MSKQLKSKRHYFTTNTPLTLESNQQLLETTICYETYGKLNEDNSNAILLCHALSGDAHAAGKLEDAPEEKGWWDFLIGPGKILDTDRYFIISSNVIGGCKGSTGPNSIDPKTKKPYGVTFPVVTIGDMVNAQKPLIDHLGITQLQAVIGGSMGAMQAIEWSLQYPQMVKSCIPIAGTHELSPQALAFDAVGRNAIISDPNWNNGNYYNQNKQPEVGLSIARMIGHITYLSEEAMNKKFGRNLQEKKDFGYDFSTDFQVESYLKYQGSKFVSRFDANSYIYLTKALSYFDLKKKYGTLRKAFNKSKCEYLVLAITSDWLYPPNQSKEIVKTLMKLNKKVTYCEIDSPYGHDAFLLDNEQLIQILDNYLQQLNIKGRK